MSEARSDDELARSVTALRTAYVAKLPELMAELCRARDALGPDGVGNAECAELRRVVHRLAGTSGTYGLREVSEIAFDLEQACCVLLAGQPSPSPEAVQVVYYQCKKLVSAVGRVEEAEPSPDGARAVRSSRCSTASVWAADPGRACMPTPGLSAGSPSREPAAPDLEQRLAELRRGYIQKLPALAVTVRAHRRALERDGGEREASEALRQLARQVGGTSGTFGLSEVGRTALALEDACRALLVELPVPSERGRQAVLLCCHELGEAIADLGRGTQEEADSIDSAAAPTAPTLGGDKTPSVPRLITPAARGEPRILAVDDDPDLLEVMGTMLRAEGYEVAVARTGPDALELLGAFHPDLVLLDVELPGMNGYEICDAIQQTEAGDHVPVVFVTAAIAEPERARAFSVGAAGFLTKPVDYSALLETTRVQLRTRQAWKLIEARTAVTDLGGGDGQTVASPERPPIGAEGRPLGPESFAAFRSCLLERLPSLTADQRSIISRLLPDRLADLTPSLGIADEEIAAHMAAFYGVRFVATLDPSRVRLGVLPAAFSRANQVVAVDLPGTGDSFAVVNPFSAAVAEALNPFLHLVHGSGIVLTRGEVISGLLQPRVRKEESLNITQLEEELTAEFTRIGVTEVGEQADATSGPIVLLMNRIIEEAHARGASDVHLEPAEKEVVVRCRVDGQLRVMHRLRPPSLIKQLVARVKVMAKLNITERRLPQDGRIEFARYSGTARDLDLRVATAPMQYGEKVVMRLLDKNKAVLPLPSLGFSGEHLSLYRRMLEAPHGLILHVGPTGSGKSMALYAALNEVRGPRVNVQTIEDPIEYTLPGVNQLLVNNAVGLDFAAALRSFLRQDPDIILVGEMRDEETAVVAVGAALTGHLVLSTLHTNDAPSTVIRLMGMGIQPFILSSVLIAVCAQRLVRRLCPSCKVAIQTPPAWSERHGAGATFFEASRRGCDACEGLGHKGRIGVFELMVPNDAVRAAMVQRELSSHELRRVAIDQGMVSLHDDAMQKAAEGICSVTEVRAICGRA